MASVKVFTIAAVFLVCISCEYTNITNSIINVIIHCFIVQNIRGLLLNYFQYDFELLFHVILVEVI